MDLQELWGQVAVNPNVTVSEMGCVTESLVVGNHHLPCPEEAEETHCGCCPWHGCISLIRAGLASSGSGSVGLWGVFDNELQPLSWDHCAGRDCGYRHHLEACFSSIWQTRCRGSTTQWLPTLHSLNDHCQCRGDCLLWRTHGKH